MFLERSKWADDRLPQLKHNQLHPSEVGHFNTNGKRQSRQKNPLFSSRRVGRHISAALAYRDTPLETQRQTSER